MSQRTANRSPHNFIEPDSFVPERWLDDADLRFAQDNKAVFEPFMVGPRGCLGKAIAWAEMNLTLAKLILNFDMEPSAKTIGDWTDTKVWLVHEKSPMYVKIKPRNS